MTPCVRKKEMQELCNNLKQIYKARTKEEAESNVESFREKYKGNKILMKKFENNVDSMLNLYNYKLQVSSPHSRRLDAHVLQFLPFLFL